jgi:hypothetical protein
LRVAPATFSECIKGNEYRTKNTDQRMMKAVPGRILGLKFTFKYFEQILD